MGRASRRKRDRSKRGKAPAMDALQRYPPAASRVTAPAPPRGRISEALVKLIDPYVGAADSLDTYQALVALGALAWNLALFPVLEREKHLLEDIRDLGAADPEGVQDMVRALAGRKTRLFPHDRRLIVHWEITPTPSGLQVTVAAEGPE
jgi:hypothetical protein